jgi:DNA-binding NarL/FixJ family response regulator
VRQTVRVLIVDDHFVSRQGILALLHGSEDIAVAGEAADGREAVEQVLRLEPDVVLMDLAMPGMRGAEATARILERRPDTAILVLTGSVLDDEILEAVRAGARGYLSKNTGAEEMARVIRQVHEGRSALPPAIIAKLLGGGEMTSGGPPEDLTERERQVLRLVARGLDSPQIGERLSVSETTVRTHVHNVLAKLGLSNRVQLVLHALRAGWLSLEDLSEDVGP